MAPDWNVDTCVNSAAMVTTASTRNTSEYSDCLQNRRREGINKKKTKSRKGIQKRRELFDGGRKERKARKERKKTAAGQEKNKE